jgi:hypothetical protein
MCKTNALGCGPHGTRTTVHHTKDPYIGCMACPAAAKTLPHGRRLQTSTQEGRVELCRRIRIDSMEDVEWVPHWEHHLFDNAWRCLHHQRHIAQLQFKAIEP